MYKPQECQRQKGCCWNIYVKTLDYTLFPWSLSKTLPVICSHPASEPHDCSGVVHWCCCVCTPQRKRQQERAHTLQVTALEFSSVRKLRPFWTVRKLSACRERHCKMCLTGSLHTHVFPKMLRISALDHKQTSAADSSAPFLLSVCLFLLIRGWKCSWTDGLNSTVAKFCRDVFGFGAKNRFFCG